MNKNYLILFVLLSTLLVACGGGGSSPDEVASSLSAEARAEAEEIVQTRCVTCHGPLGKGDGPGSAGLSPAPRDLTTKEWQRSVTDEHIESIIKYGGAGVQLSPAMPPNPDLNSKPEVVTALRLYVRGLEGK